jgi:Glycosyl hydrolases family 16
MVLSRFAPAVVAALLTLGIVAMVFAQESQRTARNATEMSDGTKMPLGDLPGWKQIGTQDFAVPAALGQVGKIYGSDLRGYSDFPDTSGRGIYTPDAVLSVADGKLDYFLHTEGGKPRVASVIPFGYDGQKYGRYSIRFRSDSLPGYKIAFMLWPSSDKWADGEVDWPEGGLDGKAYGNSAIRAPLDAFGMKFDPPIRLFAPTGMDQWHVATTEWKPDGVSWFWDGDLVGRTTLPSAVPVSPMRWTLQAETAVGTDTVAPDPKTAGHLEIDWLVQYAYAP